MQDNLAALDFTVPAELLIALNEASKPHLPYPYRYIKGTTDLVLGASVSR